MPIILDGTTGITTPGITNTGTFVFQGPVQVPAGSAATASITTAAGANTGIFFPSSSSVAITTAGTQRFVVSASGDVGIGTGSPGSKLQVSGIVSSIGSGTSIFAAGETGTYTLSGITSPNYGIAYGTLTGRSNPALTVSGFDAIAFGTNQAERMRLDSSGNLGIGTSSPTDTGGFGRVVDVQGSTGAQVVCRDSDDTTKFARLSFDGGTTNVASIGVEGTDTQVAFRAGGGEKMRLDASGNLGIGTTSPGNFSGVSLGDSILDVNGVIQVRGDATNGIAAFQLGGGTYRKAIILSPVGTDTPYLAFGVADSGSSSSATERARITAAGAMGIGTSNPQARLEVNTASGADAYALASWPFLKWDNSNELSYGGYTASQWQVLKFFTAGSERARITSGGDLLVGTTTGSFSRIVKSLSGNYAFQVINTNATDPYCMEFNMSGVTGGTGTAFLVCYDNANRLVIYGSGNVQNVNNSYGSLSDIKLKQDVVDAASQWNDVKSLRVRKYRFKENPNAALQIGLIAQELEQVSPGLVDESPDRDSEGNYLGTTTKAIKYSVLYMKAIKALQEAMARIEVLEADMAVMKGLN